VTFLRKQDPDILITELLDAEWRIAETNALIEDQCELIEKLEYEDRAGSVCLNSFSDLISGTSAEYRLPQSAVAS
jgi:hypothetical protein